MRRLRWRTPRGAALRVTRSMDPGDHTDTPTHGHPHPDRRPGTRAHSRRGPAKDTAPGAQTQRGTAAAARPKGTRTRVPRYLHVVDDRLEEPAQGAALLLRRLHARAGRRGAGGARAAGGRAGPRRALLRAGPGRACRLGALSAAGSAALGGRGPPRGGAGHGARGWRRPGGAARAAGGAASARGLRRR